MKIFCVALALAVSVAFAEDVTVKTDAGTFIGFTDTIDKDGTEFRISKFRGIPYAEAPVGELRFRKPVPKPPLSEPLQAKEFGSPCMQVMLLPNPQKGSEDCLFLNVYAPYILPYDEKIPVIVWIHGGGFMLGSANSYLPDRIVANGPVIVITLNYRLSIWGFLATGDSNSPGNYGLWDQHLAIKWVHNNIANFGGDPDRVTIAGDSAGAMSAIYQGFYPGNKGLFQRIISQSGSPFGVWGLDRVPLSEAKEFASLVGCETEDSQQLVNCLRGLDNDILNSTMNDLSNGLAYKNVFMPHSDGSFVENRMHDLIIDKYEGLTTKDTFAGFDFMAGLVSGEGYLLTPPGPWSTEEQNAFSPNSSYFKETLVPGLAGYLLSTHSDLLSEILAAEYTDFDDPENPEKIRERYVDLAGHLFFLGSTYFTVDYHARFTAQPSTYMYCMTERPIHAMPSPSWATRPTHGDDIVYVFGGEVDLSELGIQNSSPLEGWEKELADDVMTMWTNFAKTGNPNRPRDLGIDWLPYTKSHQHYLDISKSMTPRNVKTRLEGRKVHFWNNIVPAIIRESRKKSAQAEAEGTCEKDTDCSP